MIRAEQVYAKPMHLDEAVMELNLSTGEFMVFTNRSTNRVNVLYKRKDGNLGLIEAVGYCAFAVFSISSFKGGRPFPAVIRAIGRGPGKSSG